MAASTRKAAFRKMSHYQIVYYFYYLLFTNKISGANSSLLFHRQAEPQKIIGMLDLRGML